MLTRMVATMLVMLAATAAGAQSFGRNKVHYDDFDFQILQTPHFDIYYYPAEREASVQAGRLAERWYARLSRVFDHAFTERQPVVLYASHAQFTETNVVPGLLGDGVGGITEHEKGRVVLPFAAGLGETDHVLGHELVHAFQRDILRETGRSISLLPSWFLEGMAEYLSVGRLDANTSMWLRDAVHQNALPRIEQLDDPRWFPYRYGQALWAYLDLRYGHDVVARALTSKAPGGAISRLVAVTGAEVGALTTGWHDWIREVAARAAAPSGDESPAIVTARKGGGRLNVGPALSPDGRSLVFLSERDRYSVDVFLADAATGAVRRKIVQTAGDPHFDSLQFIDSAGAWEWDGGRFALAALAGGQPVLTILNMRTGGIEREIRLRQVDQVFSPTWSPDGRQIAFSALKGGFTDLYAVDLATGVVRALTSDPFADLQPAWSPDGRSIAFATDWFSSSTETLTFGNYRLGRLDVESGAITEIPGLAGSKNIDPHWSADGASLYFVADVDDVSNVYRVSLASGDLFRITNEATGVSGVTSLSPALSAAARADRLTFTVYRAGSYEIHALDAPQGTPVPSSNHAPDASSPDPSARAVPEVSSATRMPTVGLIEAKEFTVKPYRRGLSLDRLVQPYLSAGGGSTGGFLRAGIALSFGDMLGDQRLQTAVQAGRSADDFAAQAAYLNMRSRWNWGIVGGQVPWLLGRVQTRTSGATGDTLGTIGRQTDTFRQLHRQLSGMALYPLSGAKRIELTGGAHAITFDRETTIGTYSGVTGQMLTESTTVSGAAAPALLIEGGAALVSDTALFGPTAPILGERYRFGVAPTFGGLTFTTVTADYRRYVMPVRPFTIALRAIHVGRYGAGAGDPRLTPIAWTLRDIVRGYGDIGPDGSSLDFLTATGLVAGNVELRFPIPGAFTRSAASGPLPIEGLAFSDVSAFRLPRLDRPVWKGLRSLGAGVRVSAAGFIFELDGVRPLDQLSKGWTLAFNVQPGF